MYYVSMFQLYFIGSLEHLSIYAFLRYYMMRLVLGLATWARGGGGQLIQVDGRRSLLLSHSAGALMEYT